MLTPTRRQMLAGIGGGMAGMALPSIGFAATPPIKITDPSQITGPGRYSLQNDVESLDLSTYSGVEVYGNGHTIAGNLTVGSPNGNLSGVGAADFTVLGYIYVWGNTDPKLTALASIVKNITTSPSAVVGNNIRVENCTFTGTPQQTDDDVLTDSLTGYVQSHVIFDGCTFSGNYDLGLEGINGWHNVIVRNCTSSGPRNQYGIGGVFSYATGAKLVAFTLTNCMFVNNKVVNFLFNYNGSIRQALTDADAMALWPGNSFAGNIYDS